MSIDGISAQSSSQLQMDYMQLLVAQLQNQNPLEPMDNDQMTAQLTALSQLDQLETMNSSFAQVLESTEFNYAQSLVGKNVSFYDYGNEKTVTGDVSEVLFESNGVKLIIGDYKIGIEEVMAISQDAEN